MRFTRTYILKEVLLSNALRFLFCGARLHVSFVSVVRNVKGIWNKSCVGKLMKRSVFAGLLMGSAIPMFILTAHGALGELGLLVFFVKENLGLS